MFAPNHLRAVPVQLGRSVIQDAGVLIGARGSNEDVYSKESSESEDDRR